jgi:hypothetical protein
MISQTKCTPLGACGLPQILQPNHLPDCWFVRFVWFQKQCHSVLCFQSDKTSSLLALSLTECFAFEFREKQTERKFVEKKTLFYLCFFTEAESLQLIISHSDSLPHMVLNLAAFHQPPSSNLLTIDIYGNFTRQRTRIWLRFFDRECKHVQFEFNRDESFRESHPITSGCVQVSQ